MSCDSLRPVRRGHYGCAVAVVEAASDHGGERPLSENQDIASGNNERGGYEILADRKQYDAAVRVVLGSSNGGPDSGRTVPALLAAWAGANAGLRNSCRTDPIQLFLWWAHDSLAENNSRHVFNWRSLIVVLG